MAACHQKRSWITPTRIRSLPRSFSWRTGEAATGGWEKGERDRVHSFKVGLYKETRSWRRKKENEMGSLRKPWTTKAWRRQLQLRGRCLCLAHTCLVCRSVPMAGIYVGCSHCSFECEDGALWRWRPDPCEATSITHWEETEKAIYSLRRSPKLWGLTRDETISAFDIQVNYEGKIKIFNLEPLQSEANLWKLCAGEDERLHGLLMTYVDDILVAAPKVLLEAVIQKI